MQFNSSQKMANPSNQLLTKDSSSSSNTNNALKNPNNIVNSVPNLAQTNQAHPNYPQITTNSNIHQIKN